MGTKTIILNTDISSDTVDFMIVSRNSLTNS